MINNTKFWIAIFLLFQILAVIYGRKSRSTRPKFGKVRKEYSAVAGKKVTLYCQIHNIKSRWVTWNKVASDETLTVGNIVFTSDPRFHVSVSKDKQWWNLVITNLRLSDSGAYECQVTTKKRPLSRIIQLSVHARPLKDAQYEQKRTKKEKKRKTPTKRVTITGTQYVHKGQPIELTCNATKAKGDENPPERLFWYKDGKRISSKTNNPIIVNKVYTNALVSKLFLSNAKDANKGFYICYVPGVDSEAYQVFVLSTASETVKRGVNDGGKIYVQAVSEDEKNRGSNVQFETANLFIVCTFTISAHVLSTFWSTFVVRWQ